MRKVIQVIDKKMFSFSSKLKQLKEDIREVQCLKGAFELIKIDPDSVSYDTLMKEIGYEYKEDIIYISKFKGWMNEYKEEYQVKIALEKLANILSIIEKSLDNKMNSLKIKLEKEKVILKKLELLREKLNNYSKDTYIEENEFSIICNLLDELNEEESIDVLLRIGKNNSIIELERQGKLELIESLNGTVDLDTLEQMNKTRISNTDTMDKYCPEYIFKKMDNCLEDLNNLDIYYSLKQYISDCFNRLSLFKDQINKEMIEEADLFKEDLDSIDGYLMYSLAIILLLIDAIETSDEQKIADIHAIHSSSIYFEKITKEERKLIDVYKKKLNEIIDEYYDHDSYINFCHSYSSIEEDKLVDYVDFETLQSIRIMKTINTYYENTEKMNIDELSNLLNKLNEQIRIYKEILSKDEEKDTEEQLDGLDINDVLNYVIIRDPEKMMNSIESIVDEHNDVNISLFPRALYKLFMIKSSDLYLRDTCKKILVSYKTPNEYDIREERAGSIRICFRPFMTKDKRVFYELLSFAYGSCGDKKKYENLIQSVKEYNDNKNEYDEIEEKFRSIDIESMSKYMSSGLNLYNDILTMVNEKKKGLSLND